MKIRDGCFHLILFLVTGATPFGWGGEVKTHRYLDSEGIPTLVSGDEVVVHESHFIDSRPYQKWVTAASAENLIDPMLVNAVILRESGWNSRAVSTKGAMGLMQLMPKTARNWGVKDPFDPRDNIYGGVQYLRHLLSLFNRNVPLAIAAYHAGEERIIKDGAIPAIKETREYVQRVLETYSQLSSRNHRANEN